MYVFSQAFAFQMYFKYKEKNPRTCLENFHSDVPDSHCTDKLVPMTAQNVQKIWKWNWTGRHFFYTDKSWNKSICKCEHFFDIWREKRFVILVG